MTYLLTSILGRQSVSQCIQRTYLGNLIPSVAIGIFISISIFSVASHNHAIWTALSRLLLIRCVTCTAPQSFARKSQVALTLGQPVESFIFSELDLSYKLRSVKY